MKRISSLVIASTLAILPISAFAQQTVAPAKTAEPAGVTTTTPATSAKTDTHAMTTVKTGHPKTSAPVKAMEPAKS